MNSKYLTESARITDAYAQMYAHKSVNESSVQQTAKQTVNESAEGKSFSAALREGDLPVDGKGSRKTGSKLGRHPMMPFEKRDAKSTAGHHIPMKKTFGNGKVTNNLKTAACGKSTEIGSAKTGSKLGAREMLPFEKRDAKPTSIGHVGSVKNVGCVKGVKESEEEEDFTDGMEVIDTDTDTTDIENVDDDTEDTVCDGECREVLELAQDAFDQIYDTLDDDNKALVDEVQDRIDAILAPEEDDVEDGISDDSDADVTDMEDADESVSVNEGLGKEILKKGSKAVKGTSGFAKNTVKKLAVGGKKEAAKALVDLVSSGKSVGRKELAKAIDKAIKAGATKEEINTILKKSGISKRLISKAKDFNAMKDVVNKMEDGGLLGIIKKHPTAAAATAAGLAGAGTAATVAATKSALTGPHTNRDEKGTETDPEEVAAKLKDNAGVASANAAADAETERKNKEEADKQAEWERRHELWMKKQKSAADELDVDGKPKRKDSDNFGTTLGKKVGGLVGGLVGDAGEGIGRGLGGLGKGIGGAVSGVATVASDLLSAPFKALGSLGGSDKEDTEKK